MTPQPPKWADKLLEWYCRKDKLEDLQGDLYEFFNRNVAEKGLSRARMIYFLDAVKFFRTYTIKKLKILGRMNSFRLFENYWKTSVRSIARNKLFSSINVVGLAISMSVGILMIVFVSELLSYDNFHEKSSRIYRVISSFEGVYNQGDPSNLASTSPFIAKKLKESYSGIEKVLLFRRNFSGDVRYGEKIITLQGHWMGDSFFDIFSFDVKSGNPGTMLAEPHTAVITETTAEKLFDEEDPMNKVITINGEDEFTITGVVADPPKNSHIQFDILTSFITYENDQTEDGSDRYLKVTNMWMYHVYLLLHENTDPSQIQDHLDQICEEENAKSDRYEVGFYLEHLSEIVPGKDLSNQVGPTMDFNIIYIIGGLTFIVLLSACFNYTNLSIARSLRRAKEVGIRKVVGARRRQIFTQFVLEAVILSLAALVLALGLFYIIRPEFLSMDIDDTVSMVIRPVYIAYFVFFSMLVGVIAGFLPATFLSKIAALKALRDPGRLKLFTGVNLRKILIVFQFTLSIAFIIGATISYQQYKYAVNFDLGYNTENILNVRLKGNDSELIKSSFSTVPGVEAISKSAFILSSGNIWGATLKYDDPLDSISTHLNYVDENFIDLHDFELLAGSAFPIRVNTENEEHIIVNELVLKRFNMGTPDEAIGKVMDVDGEKMAIIGVVKNFQHAMIESDQHEFIFRYVPDNFYYVNLKVQSGDMISLIHNLEKKWRKIDDVHPFEAEFFEDKLQEAYSEYQYYFKIIGFLAFLAISISSLGLLGMAVYTAESRIKEISIRKVLGATERNLIYLLSKGFILMILMAGLIAVPLTYYLFDQLVLSDVANRISIGFMELSMGVFITMLIALLTVWWQTNRAARANPATTLRDE